MAKFMVQLMVSCGALLQACSICPSPEAFELNYQECKAMRSDQNHRYWNQPIAIQGCELIISEREIQ